jgi:uncharacterized protein (DUF1810 family)
MSSAFNLNRFIEAQTGVLEQVRLELRAGSKRTHWMWYIFPQLRGLGHSLTAQFYAISCNAEADAYLRHPVLGPRLIECAALVNEVEGRSAYQIFGSPDEMKFHSSVTLFSRVDPTQPVFQVALEKYFSGQPDTRTIDLCAS